MPARLTRQEKDNAILTCQYCEKKAKAKGNFYFTTKQQRYYTVDKIVAYCIVESYSRVCIVCHNKMSVKYRNLNPELYKAINKRSYDKTNYKGKWSKKMVELVSTTNKGET
jgi:hypothetical protein